MGHLLRHCKQKISGYLAHFRFELQYRLKKQKAKKKSKEEITLMIAIRLQIKTVEHFSIKQQLPKR